MSLRPTVIDSGGYSSWIPQDNTTASGKCRFTDTE